MILSSCTGGDIDSEINLVEIARIGGITIGEEGEQLSEIMQGLHVSDDLGIAYGVDLRIRRAYKMSLTTGEVKFLAPEGRGPGELAGPAQIIKKNNSELYIYDNNLNVIAEYKNGSIMNKYPAFSDHNVWVRNYNGFYHNGSIITAIDDYTNVRNMDFQNARPLAFLDFSKGKLVKKGEFSPTVDRLDADDKYPVIYFDEEMNTIFYVFRTDYTIMGYHIDDDKTTVMNSYRPRDLRIRSVEVQGSTSGNIDAAMQLGLDRSRVLGINRLNDQLLVVWKNFNEGFYDNMGDYSAGNVDYFGVMYDLPNLDNPREFTLPGRFFGTYKNKLLIEEEYGSMDLKIGFYELEHTGESSL
ncbi:MAG: hypothetical protein JJU37_03720 [Balneolaceae bacterium]|nr:hypothetical protein [Balneolaceae bacterium]